MRPNVITFGAAISTCGSRLGEECEPKTGGHQGFAMLSVSFCRNLSFHSMACFWGISNPTESSSKFRKDAPAKPAEFGILQAVALEAGLGAAEPA